MKTIILDSDDLNSILECGVYIGLTITDNTVTVSALGNGLEIIEHVTMTVEPGFGGLLRGVPLPIERSESESAQEGAELAEPVQPEPQGSNELEVKMGDHWKTAGGSEFVVTEVDRRYINAVIVQFVDDLTERPLNLAQFDGRTFSKVEPKLIDGDYYVGVPAVERGEVRVHKGIEYVVLHKIAHDKWPLAVLKQRDKDKLRLARLAPNFGRYWELKERNVKIA